MPSTTTDQRLRDRLATQHNVSIATAILVALPATYAFHEWSNAGQSAFLLLILLAVTVPTAYADLQRSDDHAWQAVVWTLGACAVVGIEFVGLYVVGTESLALSSFAASVAAFGLSAVTIIGWLLVRQRGT